VELTNEFRVGVPIDEAWAVLTAVERIAPEGRDTRGQGNASATVTALLQPDGDGTAVTVVTDLTITGKVAQFGRGVLADVSSKLIGQFVENLERDVLSTPAPTTPTTPEPPAASTNGATGPRRINAPEAQPVDLLATAGSPVAKRLVPVLVVAGIAVVFFWRRARRRAR
jgi:carbon monoxide dehydrogenase subunit G